ncbi:alpha/beta hydrolase [Microlunatus soli]|uniref:Pimeloyl-ACP methyl ester carboxylesterase n=1 Tax=Microlunatus soli TaxID=630515 RepID=A0A1H1XP76_9ACTN|nr:alpha/beta hydrolase [Microlunatus soli]SDT11048.1 Pimeloyl-ACP methyl ester carboxylesterase [Microlunatus soli]
MTDSSRPAVVLVHGAWHAPWHWHQVVDRLRNSSQPAVDTVDLPSCSSGGDLHDDATAIRTTLDRYDDVLLVAHSYGGIPATEAATGHPAVRELLYLSAYMADLGESLGGFEPADEPLNIHPRTDCEMLDDGTVIMKPDRAAEVLFHDCPDPDSAVDHLRPMTLAAIGQSPDSVAWKEIPSSYVVTTADRATAVSVQRRLSDRAGRVFEIDCGHSSFLARPDRVTEIIDQVLSTRPTT